jgi:hypothetical protein
VVQDVSKEHVAFIFNSPFSMDSLTVKMTAMILPHVRNYLPINTAS